MKKGTKVKWLLADGMAGGTGIIISDEEDGKVLVAVISQWSGTVRFPTVHTNEMHYVIWCNLTWLSAVE